MSLRPIVGILVTRWRIVSLATLSCFSGGMLVLLTSDPAYRATARVSVDFLKPNPVTGVTVGPKVVGAYVGSQLAIIRDEQVAGPTAEALGWLDDPDIQAAYAARPANDQRDFPTWVAQRIVAGTVAQQIPDSNIIEIAYRAESPEVALTVVEALRQSYIDITVAMRRQEATEGAEALSKQASVLSAQLAAAEQRENTIQDATGTFLNRRGADMEATRLAIMASRLAKQNPVVIPSMQSAATQTENALAAVRLALSQSGNLGPNHPRRLQLERQEALLTAELARTGSFAAAAAAATSSAATARSGALAAQQAKVLSMRQGVLQAQTSKYQVDRLKARLSGVLRRIAELRQQAATTAGPVTASGPPRVSRKPVFPNPWIMLGGTGFLGLSLGSLIAFMVEFSDRRVRNTELLKIASGAPVLGAFPARKVSRGPVRHARAPFRRKFALGAKAKAV